MGISIAEIRPGDVLLFHGEGFVSWAIRKIEGSEVNHAAIALPNGQLAEAGGKGLTSRALPTSFDDDNYMLVRRHLTTEPADPVLATAQAYLANRNFYAYQQIVLLAVLGLTRRIPARGLARRMIRSALDHASRALMDLLPVGASWMICSEYVYRCFDEAADAKPHPYRVEIAGIDFGAPGFDQQSWVDWMDEQEADVPVAPLPTFGLDSFDPDEAERELAPLIAEWATFAGVDPGDPLPGSDQVPLSFAVPVAPAPAAAAAAEAAQKEVVPDDDLKAAMVQFGETLKVARSTTPGVPVSFGLMPATVVAAAAKGALQGLREITVDPNFVTPKDLLFSRSFSPAERVD